MESEVTTATPEVSAPAPAATAPSTPTEPVITPTPPKADGTPPVVTPEAPAFTPNYKFKSYGKDSEIPETFRSLIKDAKSEAEVRSVFERAQAVDHLKPIHQRVVQERQQAADQVKAYEGEFGKIREGLQKVANYAQNDLDAFFDAYKIPPEKVMQYVQRKLQEQELPPEQLRQIEEGRQARREAENLRSQQTNLQSQSQEMFQNHHNMMMDMIRAQPEVNAFEADFDGRFGQGAFQQHVNDYGDRMYRQGKYVPPHEAVRAVRAYYSRGFSQNPAPSAYQGGAGASANPVPPPQPIPNVGSGKSGSSPTKPKFQNLDQMRAYVKQQLAEA